MQDLRTLVQLQAREISIITRLCRWANKILEAPSLTAEISLVDIVVGSIS